MRRDKVGFAGTKWDKWDSEAEASLVAERTRVILPPPAATRSRLRFRLSFCTAQ